jgi:hypothetical protein
MHTRSGEYSDSFTARNLRTRSTTADALFGALASLEVRAAHAFFYGCEVGGMLGFVRIGLELRCALLDERDYAPFSAAISAGAAQQIMGGFGLLILEEGEDYKVGQELRIGLDLSSRGEDVTPLLNVGLGYLLQYREILNGLPVQDDDDAYPDMGEIYVWRDELRLSVPLGLAFEYGDYELASRGRWTVAVVPEITLAAWNRTTPRHQGLQGTSVSDFEQVWAIYLTLGGEVEW